MRKTNIVGQNTEHCMSHALELGEGLVHGRTHQSQPQGKLTWQILLPVAQRPPTPKIMLSGMMDRASISSLQ